MLVHESLDIVVRTALTQYNFAYRPYVIQHVGSLQGIGLS